jgi:hypothetical protein
MYMRSVTFPYLFLVLRLILFALRSALLSDLVDDQPYVLQGPLRPSLTY